MGQKEDEAADFLLKMLNGDVNVVDVNDEDVSAMNKFKDIVDMNNIKFDDTLEKEYQEYIKQSKENGYSPVGRTEFLGIRHSTQKPKDVH